MLLDLSAILQLPYEKKDATSSGARHLLEPLGKELVSSANTGAECQIILSHQCDLLGDILENIQSRNSAAEHIVQDIKAINNRATTAAVASLDKLDQVYSETLFKLIDHGNEVLNKLQSKFKSTLKRQREEFKKAFECATLLETGIEARYKLLRDSIRSVMQRSFERLEVRFDEIAALDKQNFNWTVNELKTTKATWDEKSESKRVAAHATVNRKLQNIMDSTITTSTKV